MVLNVELSDTEVEALGGGKTTLSAPMQQLQSLPLGVSALDDIEAVISMAGVTIAFELEQDEIRAIQRGNNKFLIHFHTAPGQGIIPFRFIFEKAGLEVNNGQKKDNPTPRLQEPDRGEETS